MCAPGLRCLCLAVRIVFKRNATKGKAGEEGRLFDVPTASVLKAQSVSRWKW